MPIRYADDFIVLVSTANGNPGLCRAAAEQEKSALGEMLLAELGLSLSVEKTLVTPVTGAMGFLGHHLRVRPHPSNRHTVAHLLIPKDRSQRLRRSISAIFDRSMVVETLDNRLRLLNPLLRGWGNFYRHAWGAKRIFAAIDHHVWWTILRWLHKKHPDARMRDIAKQYGWHKPRQRSLRWRDGETVPISLSALRVVRYQQGSDPGPAYA